MYYTYLDTPIGELLLAGERHGLQLVSFPDGPRKRSPKPDWQYLDAPFRQVRAQLTAYFDGTLREFSVLLDPRGTAFQLRVLEELRKIPYGTTITYGEMTQRIGRPRTYRAVGAANARNPIPIILPCHRVIGSDGSLTGFGGGLATKEALLLHEKKHRDGTV